MSKFVLKETEYRQDDRVPIFEHEEEYPCRENAQARMKDLYHEQVIEGNPDTFSKTELNENSAMYETYDGMIVEWDIREED